jgi:hypothetical protein
MRQRQIETYPTSGRPILMTFEEREEVEREMLMRALAIVQKYQDENWRRLRVNDICSDIKRLLNEEAARLSDRVRN